ncbi:hypothetical protein WAE56_17325 [Iodobacter sp. LRB]|uniref:hypothetical protein n=1 Tax=unclassified Iodobacter TaxID=235634 RepID=UPI000C0F88B4|nr:hypothetical protein [Iodobacter sp. BJB302]PHV00229.1 hypothetical protein CSQ88_18215 [Iodobacter sp. BJB302]
MDIILLCGDLNTGKTTTMNLVYSDLITKGATVVVPKVTVGGNPLDFECVLIYKGKLVAIFSMGDYLHECWSAAIKYAYCDKLILAYSNKFERNLATVVGNCQNHVVVTKLSGNAAMNNPNDAAIIVAHI